VEDIEFFKASIAKTKEFPESGGHKYAIVATANKIAMIYYKMLSQKKECNPVD